MKEKASSRIRYYENSQGPVIGTCNDKVIREDGLYFRDINGDGKLNTYKDWRKSPKERAKALAEDLSAEEKIGLLFLNSWKMGMEQEDKDFVDETGFWMKSLWRKDLLFLPPVPRWVPQRPSKTGKCVLLFFGVIRNRMNWRTGSMK